MIHRDARVHRNVEYKNVIRGAKWNVITRWTTIALTTKESSLGGIINRGRKLKHDEEATSNRKIQSRTIVSYIIDLSF